MRNKYLPASPSVSEIVGSGGWFVEAVRLKFADCKIPGSASVAPSERGGHESAQGSGPSGHEAHPKARDQRYWGVEVLTLFEFCGLWCAQMRMLSREMSSCFACESRSKG